MTQYFTKFPRIGYNVSGDKTDYKIVIDIIHHATVLEAIKKVTNIYYSYTIKEEETPEIIAAKLYGSSQYHWIVLYLNGIFDLWTQWPLNYNQFLAYLIKTYGTIEASETQIHHYENPDGYWIDEDTYNEIGNGTIVYAYDYESSLNELKKDIKLVDPKYTFRIERELDALMVK